MIHLLAYEVQKHLKEQKFPIRVAYGPEAFARDSDTSLIVLHREGESDSFKSPSAPGRNPRNYQNRTFGFAALVFAKATKAGSRREDHEVLCDVFVNALVCALVKASNGQVNNIVFGPGHILLPSERSGCLFERFPGVVYELKASLVQSVQDFDWEGTGREVVALTSLSTDVSANDSDAEGVAVKQYVGNVDVD